MNEKSENIDRFFKKKLENYEETPGSVVLDNLAEKLGHKKERRLLIFVSRIAAGITLVIALGLAYHYLNKDTSEVLTESTEQPGEQAKEELVTSSGKLTELEDRKKIKSQKLLILKSPENLFRQNNQQKQTITNPGIYYQG